MKMKKIQIKKQTLVFVVVMGTVLFGFTGVHQSFATEVPPKVETETEVHQHDFQLIKTVKATCKNDGYKEYKCTTCNEIKKEIISQKLNHNFKYVKTVNSTCTKTGYKLYKCSKCSTTKKTTISKLKHTYTKYSTKASTCTKTGTKYWKCKVCGVKKTTTISKKSHTYKWVKTVKPTCTKTGYKLYKCSKCSTTKKITIPKLETVSFNKTGFKAPKESDFGKNYKYTYSIYKNLLNSSEKEVKITFNSSSERDNFDNKLNTLVDPCGSPCVIYMHSTNVNGKFKTTYYTTKSSCKEHKETMNYAYNACKNAGVKNGMDKKTAVKKINAWICKNMTYKITNGDALSGFKTKKGQCMTYALMFEVMCEVSGIQTEYVSGTANGGAHGWNKVKIDGKWYWVDSTWNDAGSKSNDKYLLDTSLWKSHKVR